MSNQYENQLWHRIIKRTSLILSLKSMIVMILCYDAGTYLSSLYHFSTPQLGGLWCAISGIIVLQVFIRESFKAAWLRIVGSFVGACTSLIFILWLGYSIKALAICVFATVILTSIFNIKETFRLASLTAAIIIILGMIHPTEAPLINAFSRFIESAMGAAIAIIITAIFFPIRKKLNFLGN